MWVSLFVCSPKMRKCDGKMEIFCWLALTLDFLSHICVQGTELHGNGASTKSVPRSKAFHTSLGLHCSPTFTLQATGREGMSVHTSQDEESGLTYRDPAAINLQSFAQQQRWVKKPQDFLTELQILLCFPNGSPWTEQDPEPRGWRGRDSAASYRFILV